MYVYGILTGQLECPGHSDFLGIAKIIDTISNGKSYTIHKYSVINDTQ